MWELLLWLYLTNATLLINHEIDSAYWKEWELFRLPGGIAGFIVIHLPLIFLVLWGVVLVIRQTQAGLFFSLALAAGGLFAFGIHTWFIRRGRPEFKTPVSQGLLAAILVASLAQGLAALKVLLT